MGPDLESRLSHSSSSRSPLTLPITVCSGATATSMWVCLGVFLLACVLARVGVCKGAFHACICVFFVLMALRYFLVVQLISLTRCNLIVPSKRGINRASSALPSSPISRLGENETWYHVILV